MEKIVEMKQITKVFPGVIANEDVDFDLKKGEIHVLLGENGAGKTTLMNVLYGLYQPEKGDIIINGRKEKIKDPSYAIKLGIGMIHQHFMLVDNFTVTENIILGNEPLSGIKINMSKAREEVRQLADKYGFMINPDDLIENMTVGQQQKVEILKALYRDAQILILDEPTAVLTPQEIDELEVILRNLTKEGKSIILITHKLKEIMKMSDRVTILRRGKVTGSVNTSDTNIDELAELMVGRKVNLAAIKTKKKHGNTLLEVKDLVVKDERGVEAVKGASFILREGEILGIAGVDGNGQKELIEAITGLVSPESGAVYLKNMNLAGMGVEEIIDIGLSSIPEDRHKRGLILDLPLYDNVILGQHKREVFNNKLFLNYSRIKEYTRGLIKDFDIRTPDENALARGLSGGNQQKLIVAREINKNPKVLIASQPTRGLDVGAIEYIHKRLVEERDNNKGVLLVSLELDEILHLSDRIAVIYDGKISKIIDADKTNENELGILMAGGNPDEQKLNGTEKVETSLEEKEESNIDNEIKQSEESIKNEEDEISSETDVEDAAGSSNVELKNQMGEKDINCEKSTDVEEVKETTDKKSEENMEDRTEKINREEAADGK